MSNEITFLTRADHDPGSEWPDFYREAIIAAHGAERHASRVAATRAAARAWLERDESEASDREIEILIHLDLGGVGGRGGYEGGATRRIPYAATLGSGRWHACDGAAWRAAAEAAISGSAPPTLEELRRYSGTRCADVWDAANAWAWAWACRTVLSASTPEEAHAWDELRVELDAWKEWHRLDEDLATLPDEARAILTPTVRLDSKAGPWVEIINRRGVV